MTMTTLRAQPGAAAPAVPLVEPACLNALSIDVEEYFHAEVFAGRVSPNDWHLLPRRAAVMVERIARLLQRHESKATFFILGWTAEYLAPLLQHLVTQGHEIACHGYGHQHFARMDAATLRDDLRRAIDAIVEHVGVRPRGYRAPTFSLTHETRWALDVIAEAGFEYDSSIFPIRHDRYGVPDAPPRPFVAVGETGRRIAEFPPLTVGAGPVRMPVAGGGYMRLLPGWVMRQCVAARQVGPDPVLLYLHPWELDAGQPRLPLPWLSQWRHRVGLARTEEKLERLLAAFRFDTVERVLGQYRRRAEMPEFRL